MDVDGIDGDAPADLIPHVDTALKFLKRERAVAQRFPQVNSRPRAIAAFGLDPPAEVAVLETRSGLPATVNFGSTNPAGTSHYVRLAAHRRSI